MSPVLPLFSDLQAITQGFGGPDSQRRRDVLRETVAAFRTCEPADLFHARATANLARWQAAAEPPAADQPLQLLVLPGDWGQVTLALTKRYGACFAALNMANPNFPGGAYRQGAIAQEENMFRRTDCHFSVRADQLDPDEPDEIYTAEMTRLLTGQDGAVYLDHAAPRACIRGAEDRAAGDLGYAWLADDDVFPFFELRAAAQDLRDGSAFDAADARRHIAAQLDTLQAHGVRHAVLSAFGCGAFQNPAEQVARLYREEIAARAPHFAVIAFAIYAAGYGPDNYAIFRSTFADAQA